MNNPWVIIGIITVLLFGGAIFFSSQSNEASNEGVTTTAHIKGNPDATVKLVEYGDFQCPACAAFDPVVAEIMEEYGDSLSLEYRHFPLPIHNFAYPAAMAAEAAGQQGKFFEYASLLFENQKEWGVAQVPGTYFVEYAEQLELDIDMFTRHQKSTVLRDKVRADAEEARERGADSTPTFFLNGEKMDFTTYEEFVGQIAAAIDPTSVTASTTQTVEFGL